MSKNKKINEVETITQSELEKKAVFTILGTNDEKHGRVIRSEHPYRTKMIGELKQFLTYLYKKYSKQWNANVQSESVKTQIRQIIKEEIQYVKSELDKRVK
jgi:hypothetical protein